MKFAQASISRANAAPGYSVFNDVHLGTIAIIAAVLLVFVSGSFIVAQVLGVKRELEGVLIAPMMIAAVYYWINCPRRSMDPLVGFVLVKTIVEISLRHEVIWILDSVASMAALTVILSVPPRTVRIGAKVVSLVAGVFAAMALFQWLVLFFVPDFADYGLVLSDTDVPVNGIQHPFSILGLFTDESYTFLGRSVGRIHSFTKEPSLNLLYFLYPACLSLLVKSKSSWFWCAVILIFCFLSLSGSIFMALGFSAVWWILLRFVGIRIAFTYGLPLFMVAYLYSVKASGLEPLVNAMNYTAQYGDFLNKGESLTNRALNSSINLETALSTPLGSPAHPDLPGPFLINSTLEAGWLGCLFLLVFLGKMGTQLHIAYSKARSFSEARGGVLLVLGAMSTVVIFNDYQMSNYAGVVLLGLVYRVISINNEQTG